MQAWLRISLLLCTFGFFREMRPSEPFVVEYLTGPDRNITSEDLNREIYPFGTYSVLIQLVIVFLITDILRYKAIIIVSALSGIVLFGILLWTQTVWELLIGQVFFGTFMASEVAYYTYIYAKVEKSRYQIVSGHTRSAILCGKFLGGVLAQVLVSTDSLDYRGLHYISFASQIVSLFVAVALPSVSQSIYFYKTTKGDDGGAVVDSNKDKCENNIDGIAATPQPHPAELENGTLSPKFSWKNASRLLWQHTVSAYTNPTVLKWSIWWSLATCGQLQVISYAQILWKEIDENHQSYYNGAVEATVTLLGAVGAMTAGMLNGVYRSQWILTICSILMGAFMIISAVTNILWVAYAMYVMFGILYFFVITIASAIVARNLSDDSFGLIFGINTLIALILQTILTLVVVTEAGYSLAPRDQYIVYGSYFVVLAVIFIVVVIVEQFIKCTTTKKEKDLDVESIQ
ncbi:thiamine transporter 1 [Musca vetustissima]|uniref:thiamine transporter 1 n=1 Tax=Musca vetustissima TaxID=27455 RepID=UPI002AB6939D|nr:thiamine transporter 1 [Musca vetustissima]